MTRRVAGIAAVSLIVALVTVGCSAPDDTLAEVSTRPVPTESASPSTEPVNAEPEPLTCTTLAPDVALAEFEANGFVLDEAYESALRDENAVNARFFDLGGLACRWYLPNSGGVATFGYSEISEADAQSVQAELAASGYERTAEGTDVLFTLSPANNPLGMSDTFLFESGAWYQAIEATGVNDVRENIRERDAAAG